MSKFKRTNSGRVCEDSAQRIMHPPFIAETQNDRVPCLSVVSGASQPERGCVGKSFVEIARHPILAIFPQ